MFLVTIRVVDVRVLNKANASQPVTHSLLHPTLQVYNKKDSQSDTYTDDQRIHRTSNHVQPAIKIPKNSQFGCAHAHKRNEL